MTAAFQAAGEIACPIINSGPGGKTRDEENFQAAIDLLGYVRVLHENGCTGALDLAIIGAKEYGVSECVAAAARGHMHACLQACGAR